MSSQMGLTPNRSPGKEHALVYNEAHVFGKDVAVDEIRRNGAWNRG